MAVYSHSRITTFEQCPLKFKFRYIDKLEAETEEYIEAFLGSRVHETLEWLYAQIKMMKIPKEHQVLVYFEDNWKKNFNSQIKTGDFSAEDYFNKGKRFLEVYYKSYFPFDENTIATEKKIVIDLDGSGKYILQGFIDRLVYDKDDKTYEIHDYKTNNQLKTKADIEEDRQLALYSIAVKEMYPDAKSIALVWHFLAFDKEFRSFRTDKQIEQLKKNTIKIIQKIESTQKWHAKESGLCNWCEFKPHCRKFRHLYEVEKKTPNQFLKDDGVQLVNKYAELNQKKKEFLNEIEAELEQLKEAIIKFAKKKGVEVIFGSNNKLSVNITEKFKFPAKGTEERKELDDLLKKLGKWNEISCLDTFALEKAMEDEEWPKNILDKIKKFGEFEESTRLSLSKKKDLEEE